MTQWLIRYRSNRPTRTLILGPLPGAEGSISRTFRASQVVHPVAQAERDQIEAEAKRLGIGGDFQFEALPEPPPADVAAPELVDGDGAADEPGDPSEGSEDDD